jgi:ferrous-iron efflux pump FieF
MIAASPSAPPRASRGPAADRARETAQRAAIASVCVALVLITMKGWAVYRTGSIAVLGSLADSGLDLIASLITLGGVRWAARPADDDHRFGHGKAEALSAFSQVLIILGSSAYILWSAVERLLKPAPPVAPEAGIGVSIVGVILTVLLIRYQARAIRETGSVAIATDRLHYVSDLVVNLSVIAALVLEPLLNVRGADAVFGIGIALYLALGAVRSGGEAIDVLMDKEWNETDVERLCEAARSVPQVRLVHEVRTRGRGLDRFAQFHIWVDPGMTVTAAHDVVDSVEAAVGRAFPGIELMVHIDPEGHFDARPGPAKRA